MSTLSILRTWSQKTIISGTDFSLLKTKRTKKFSKQSTKKNLKNQEPLAFLNIAKKTISSKRNKSEGWPNNFWKKISAYNLSQKNSLNWKELPRWTKENLRKLWPNKKLNLKTSSKKRKEKWTNLNNIINKISWAWSRVKLTCRKSWLLVSMILTIFKENSTMSKNKEELKIKKLKSWRITSAACIKITPKNCLKLWSIPESKEDQAWTSPHTPQVLSRTSMMLREAVSFESPLWKGKTVMNSVDLEACLLWRKNWQFLKDISTKRKISKLKSSFCTISPWSNNSRKTRQMNSQLPAKRLTPLNTTWTRNKKNLLKPSTDLNPCLNFKETDPTSKRIEGSKSSNLKRLTSPFCKSSSTNTELYR